MPTSSTPDEGVHRARVVAVLSAFRPEPTLIAHCEALAPQVAGVIVVDDGSGDQAEPVLRQLEAAGVTVLRQTQNSGIAAAMNRGLDAALAAGAEFVVTFDQDSNVPGGFVDALVGEADRAASAGLRVAMVAPEFYSQTRQTGEQVADGFLVSGAPIQSGLLMPASVVRELGPQREDFFIDLVETEYYLRARVAGFVSLCVPGLTLPHGFGHRLYVHFLGKRLVKAGGRPRMVAVSSPFRYYYRARNRVVLNREYARAADPAMRRLLRRDARNDLLLDYAVAIWSARGKFSLLSLMLAGWRDGFSGRLGKMPARLMARSSRISWRHPVPLDED
jgi:rhamnosyltransferase